MDWLSVLPFQHETMHTAVLRYLLAGKDGARVAQEITDATSIEAVVDPEVEQRLAGRRAVDLAADLKLAGDHTGELAVEVKIDSAWTAEQLQQSVPQDCHGVLLALGYTALAVSPEDLDELDGYVVPWQLVGPRRFAEVVLVHAEGDEELHRYGKRLHEEAAQQERALAAVEAGKPVTWGRPSLHDAAWLSLVKANIARRHPGESDAAVWARACDIRATAHDRGAHWRGAWRPLNAEGQEECGLILEFVASLHHHKWSLAIKSYGPDGRKRRNSSEASRHAPRGAFEWQPGRRTTNATVWSADVTGSTPAQAVDEGEVAAAWMKRVGDEVAGHR
jgi:hypothetical protein